MTDSETTSAKTTADQDLMDTFVQMSALLTGFAAAVIAPTLDPTDLKTTIFETAQKNTGAALEELLEQYASIAESVAPGKTVDQMNEAQKTGIGRTLMQDETSQPTETARAIIKAWYLGSWYQPFDHGDRPAGTQTVMSDQAYIQGLAWKSMQSHAMGNSTWTFGYWKDAPPPLSDFTGGNPILDPDSSSDQSSTDGSEGGAA